MTATKCDRPKLSGKLAAWADFILKTTRDRGAKVVFDNGLEISATRVIDGTLHIHCEHCYVVVITLLVSKVMNRYELVHTNPPFLLDTETQKIVELPARPEGHRRECPCDGCTNVEKMFREWAYRAVYEAVGAFPENLE